jgi:hypothetical protein
MLPMVPSSWNMSLTLLFRSPARLGVAVSNTAAAKAMWGRIMMIS